MAEANRAGPWAAQVIAVEQKGVERPFVSLDDLERLTREDLARLRTILGELRAVFEGWHDRTGAVYSITKAES
jgi:hypothetical protein